jgi:phytoene synthase
MDALYAFMRHTDDLADSPMQSGMRQDAIMFWRKKLPEALSGGRHELSDAAFRVWNSRQSTSIPPDPGDPMQSPVIHHLLFDDLLLPALADTVARFKIPHEHLFAVIDGVEMDLAPRRYETFDELQVYCERVASAVGLACIYVWGFRDDAALPHARSAGIALQLTNILRDIQEDSQGGRLYLPLGDLRQCGYSPDESFSFSADERFHKLIAMEVERAEAFYRDGAELMEWLDPAGRRIFGLMVTTYHELLRKIAREPKLVLQGRVRLGRLRRLRLAMRWMFLPARRIGF